MRDRILIFVACILNLDCTGATSPKRELRAEKWDTVAVFGGEINDTVLSLPSSVTAFSGGVAVSDDVKQQVIWFDSSGQVGWIKGRKGAGPGEYNFIADMRVTRSGTLWVLDAGNLRLSELSPDGLLLSERPIDNAPAVPWNILEYGDRATLLTTYLQAPIIDAGISHDRVTAGSTREVMWNAPVPAGATTTLIGVSDPSNSRRWAVFFMAGPGFVVFDGDTSHAHSYVVPLPFQHPITPQAAASGQDSIMFSAVSVDAANGKLYVLFGGQTFRPSPPPSSRTEYIDVYTFEGTYEYSYKLPFEAKEFAVDGNRFYVLVHDPIPAVYVLRPLLND